MSCCADAQSVVAPDDMSATIAAREIDLIRRRLADAERLHRRNFSVERLMDFLTALGHDVEVRVTPTRKEHGQLSVVVAA